ncbi:hypothetical protein ACLGIH_03510 [Streptomyces sp. HMX87]|uniref:hypothetical protein n=1 Tax=Streptomyces sp. HMX87 TaxID=3390849 RepID=UPI003A8A88EA
MTDHRAEGPGESGDPIPRDMPDQQAHAGEDPWEVAPGLAARGDVEDAGDAEATDDAAGADDDGSAERAGPAEDVPDTDEAGTGRQGERQTGAVHPEHPAPDESSA